MKYLLRKYVQGILHEAKTPGSSFEKEVEETLLRRFVKTFLFEVDETKTGVGTRMAQQKEEARKAYEAALQLQIDWNAASEKNEKWRARKASQKKNLSPEERKALEPVWPKFADGSSTASTSRNKVAKELEDAKKHYRSFDPRLTTSSGSFERLKYSTTGGEKTEENMQKPDEDEPYIMSIDKVKPITWYAWPKEVLESGIPYGSAADGEEGGAEAGVGPAEAWLAFMFGGKKQGGSVSYDVVTRSKKTGLKAWEVKELNKPSETIRPGTHGLKVFAKPYQNLKSVITQLRNFYILANKLGFMDANNKTFTEDDKDVIRYVKDFVVAEKEMISDKGEISEERFTSLYTALEQVEGFLKKWTKKEDIKPGENPDTDVSLNDKEYHVDKPTFIDVARKVQKATGEKPPVENIEILLSALRHTAFVNPTNFLDDFFNSVDPEAIFAQTSGVFIVNRRGFLMLPKETLRDTLIFKKVTQGKPRFGLAIGFGP